MPSTPLHAALSARRDEVIVRWKALVRGTVAPAAMPTVELVDQLPSFLAEIVTQLRTDAGFPAGAAAAPDSATAAEHGHQRLRMGFSLDAVVREYGALRDAVLCTAEDAGVDISLREAQIVFNAIIGGIANAVSEYARQRDAQLQRQHNEHSAFIAHELRNPLSSARLAVEQLRVKHALPTDVRAAQVLEQSLAQMQELIDHTLDVARVASGIELRRSAVRLGALIDEVRLAVACDIEAKGVEVRAHVDDAEVAVDLRLARSALTNLVRNAIKYTAPGSAVELSAAVVGRQVHIEVADRCGGLPPGRVEEVFAPFVRLSAKETGFGLGLAIAKQAVDAHGGALRVQNVPGEGCIFVVDLPAAPEGASPGTGSASPAER